MAEDQLNFTVQVVTGEKGEVPPSPVISGPFEEGDDWWYGENQGKCDGTVETSDAAKELMLAMNATLPDPEGNFYVIHPTVIKRTGGEPNVRRENDPNPPDNIYDYYLFYGTEEIGSVELCLSRNRMNIYYGYLRDLLLTKIPNEEFSPLYKLINVENMVGLWSFVNENGEREYFHEGWFNYGIKIHYISDTIYPIQID